MKQVSELKGLRLFLILIFCFVLILNFSAMADLKKGDTPPAFQLPVLNDEGELRLEDFAGKVVIIHLWKCQ